MINITSNRTKYIVRPTDSQLVEAAYEIQYTVSIAGSTVFVGKSRNFYDPNDFRSVYEVDCSDFIDAYIASQTGPVSSVTVTVVFTFYNNSGSSLGTETKTVTWEPEVLSLSNPTLSGQYAIIQPINCGVTAANSNTLYIPLSIKNGVLEGKTINRLEKTDWMDRYGDKHNGSNTNHYELECYIDSCWLGSIKTKGDLDYEKIMIALQNATRTIFWCSQCEVSGIITPSTRYWNSEAHVKDIEKIETYSSYSGNQKVPTYKLTIEIYNH